MRRDNDNIEENGHYMFAPNSNIMGMKTWLQIAHPWLQML